MTKKHSNQPLLKEMRETLFSTSIDLNNYVLEYPQHEVIPRYYVRSGFFATQHVYEDGLLINQVWKLKNKTFRDLHEELGGIKKVEHLLHFVKLGWITLLHSDVWEYSKGREQDKEWKKEVNTHVRLALEYQVSEPSSIPNFIFDILTSDIANQIQFEKYISDKEKQQSN